MFLRLYEKKTKFRYLFKKGHDSNEMQKDILSCLELKYNGFEITRHMSNKEQQLDFTSVDIIYKTVRRVDNIIECYFSTEINQAFIACYQTCKNDKTHTTSAFVCFYYNNYCISERFFKKHLKACSRKPIVYNFNSASLSTFKDNFRLMGNQPFSFSFDYETTCGKDKFIFGDHEDKLTYMFVVSYWIVIYFHKSYLLNEIAIVRSFMTPWKS